MRAFLPFATLLGAAFLLGCQEQGSGPVAPAGLGPQLHASHLTCEGHRKNDVGCDANGGTETFEVTVTGDIMGGPTTGTGDRNQILVKPFTLDFGTTFFTGSKLTCNITGTKTGPLAFHKISGSNPSGSAFIQFFFRADGTGGATNIRHSLQLDGIITNKNDWLPTASNTITGGRWEVQAQGKNHQDGCIGEDGPGAGDDLSFTITVVPKP